jgi:Recombinase zinc beta ribbon domain
LLAGLLRCRRCERKLTLRYSGAKNHIPRYSCTRGWMDNGEPRNIAFGGLRVNDAIENALLTVVGPAAIAAAVSAQTEARERRDQVRDGLKRDLEAARYAADHAFRQYDPLTRPTALWLVNWKHVGTRRLRALGKLKARSLPMTRKRPYLQSIRCGIVVLPPALDDDLGLDARVNHSRLRRGTCC